ALDAARQKQAALAQQAAAVASRLSALEDALEQLSGDRRETEEALAQAEADREALPPLDQARARLGELRRALAEERRQFADCQSAVDRLEREAEARSERLAAVAVETNSWSERSDAAKRHLAELDSRRRALEEEIAALAERPAEIATARQALIGRIEEAAEKHRATADRLAIGETRLGDADRRLKAEEQALATCREERVRIEAAVGQAEHELAHLVARVRERLDCATGELAAVAELDPSQELPARDEVDAKLQRLLRERDNMGPVNLRAEAEAEELDQRIAGMQSERSDLVAAIGRLRQGISSLNREGRERLLAAFEQVNNHFSELFVRLFGGGRAHLALTEAEDPLEAGLEIMASPPGKRLQVMSLLSGGEQALTALALLFAVFLTNPAPICVLDEVDAPLDDSNVDRFCSLVEELAHSTSTRFLVITHHRMTMSRVDRLYGVTMSERGVSQLVSVDLMAAERLRESA
ncbi:MAG: chromosome partitioning protein ParA, partial [Kiloniellales bacterium]